MQKLAYRNLLVFYGICRFIIGRFCYASVAKKNRLDEVKIFVPLFVERC